MTKRPRREDGWLRPARVGLTAKWMAMLPSGYAKLEWKKILTSPGIGEYSIVARGLLCSRCRVRRRHATRVLTSAVVY